MYLANNSQRIKQFPPRFKVVRCGLVIQRLSRRRIPVTVWRRTLVGDLAR